MSAGERRCTRCGKTPSERVRIAAASPGGLSFLTCLRCTYADQPAPTIADDGAGAMSDDDGFQTLRNEAADELRRGNCQDCAHVIRVIDTLRATQRDLAAVTTTNEQLRRDAERYCKQYVEAKGDLAATRERLIDAEAERDAAVRRAEKLLERLGCEVCGCAYDSEQDDNTTVWCDDCRPDFPQQAYNEMRDRAEAAEARVRELERRVATD